MNITYRSSYIPNIQQAIDCALPQKLVHLKFFLKDNKFTYLLEGVNYNRNLFAGPPRSVSEEDMDNLFGDWAEFHLLESKSPDCELLATKELAKYGEKAEQTLYLITPKL